MMNGDISPEEWEELSALLDDQLSSKEKKGLDSRLQQSPQLRSALSELQTLRSLLRIQPGIRAPRNYLLTADTEGIRTRRRQGSLFFPVLSFTATVAFLMFVFVFVSDLFLGGSQVIQRNEVMEEQAEFQLMEKALPESAASDDAVGEIGEAQAVPLEPVEGDLEMMEKGTEEFDRAQLDARAPEPQPKVETPVSEPGEELLKNEPYLIGYLISNRMVLRLLEIFLVFVAFSSGVGAFYFYQKRG